MSELKTYDKYITVIEGMDYRTIAAELETIGVSLKHATVRNITERTMPDFLESFLKNLEINSGKVNKAEVLKTVQFYDNLIEIMSKVVAENPDLVFDTIGEIKENNIKEKKTESE